MPHGVAYLADHFDTLRALVVGPGLYNRVDTIAIGCGTQLQGFVLHHKPYIMERIQLSKQCLVVPDYLRSLIKTNDGFTFLANALHGEVSLHNKRFYHLFDASLVVGVSAIFSLITIFGSFDCCPANITDIV